MEEAVRIENRGDLGPWAIEVAKQIVSEHGFELARAARDGLGRGCSCRRQRARTGDHQRLA